MTVPGSTDERENRDLTGNTRRLCLGFIIVVALVPRMYRLSWGLPFFILPDSFDYFIEAGARVANGELIPEAFIHPPLLVYILGAVDLAWSSITGQTIPVGLKQAPEILYSLAMLGRIGSVAFAIASVIVLYLLARRLLGTRVALLAATAFALSPVHVLESHRVNPDGLAILFTLLAAHRAVVAADRRDVRHLYAAFLFAGGAAATKYNGLAAVTVPAWVALCWTGATVPRRLRLCATGGLLAVLVLAIVLLPAAFAPDRFLRSLQQHVLAGYRQGTDLTAQGWVFYPYVYFLVVVAPYLMGWLVYLFALSGFGVLGATSRRSLGVVLAALIPFLLVQGGAIFGPPRWYQPLVPFFCLSAAAAMEQLWSRSRRIGGAVVILALGYTATVTASQCLRLGLGPQTSLVAWLSQHAEGRQPSGGLVVGYPSGLLRHFDPLGPMLHKAPVKVVYPPLRSHPSHATRKQENETRSEQDSRERYVRWLRDTDLDYFILPSTIETVISMNVADEFYTGVVDGSLGLHLETEFRTRFFTEPLYVWADPSMNTHWAVGINGYKVFARVRDASSR